MSRKAGNVTQSGRTGGRVWVLDLADSDLGAEAIKLPAGETAAAENTRRASFRTRR